MFRKYVCTAIEIELKFVTIKIVISEKKHITKNRARTKSEWHFE